MVDDAPKFSDIGLVASALEPYRVAGTEDFIPPELLCGTKKITPQSGYEADIYAFWKTLYTIFSGSRANFFPIIGADKLATPEGKIINRTINAVCHPSYARRLKTSDEFHKALRGIPGQTSPIIYRYAIDIRYRREQTIDVMLCWQV